MVCLCAGQSPAQLGDILGNILGKVVTGGKITIKDVATEVGKVVAVEASISIIKEFSWYDARLGRTVTLDDYCRSVLCSPSLRGTEFDVDPVGTIIRGIAYRDHLLDAAIFRTREGSAVSINQAHMLGFNPPLTSELIGLYHRVKAAYKQQNPLGFAGALSQFLSTLALNNETVSPPPPEPPPIISPEPPAVAAVPQQENPRQGEIEAVPVKAESGPPPAAEPTVAPEVAEVHEEEVASKEVEEKPVNPPSMPTRKPDLPPVSATPPPQPSSPQFATSHLVTKVVGRFAYVALGESRAIRPGSPCVLYFPTNVGRQPVAEGYVTTVKPGSCIVEIQRVYAEKNLKQYSLLAPEFNKKSIALH
jgi:hypothetical protein